MFDQCEQVELFCLLTVLFVGVATVWFKQRQPEALESLRVVRAAVEVLLVE